MKITAMKYILLTAIFILAGGLTSGPKQPEFSSFEPVATTNMVNEFTGDFTYNLPLLEIPGPQGSGYALSLSYHSGTTPEEEASWVGYGWTLNPGAITRNKRGFPDDSKGDKVIYWNKTPENQTVTVGRTLSAGIIGSKVFSQDWPLRGNVGVNYSSSIRYNNYRGFGTNRTFGINGGGGISNKGISSLNMAGGYMWENGESKWNFSVSINPLEFLNKYLSESANDINKALKQSEKPDVHVNIPYSFSLPVVGSQYSLISYNEDVRQTQVTGYSGKSTNISISVHPTVSQLPISPTGSVGIFGNYTYQKNESPDALNSYGYMYSGDAPADANAVMDYYTEKHLPFKERNHFLAIPFSNADIYSVTGEGVIGSFRLFHKQPGHFRPNRKSSTLSIFQAGLKFHVGPNAGLAADLGAGDQRTVIGSWGDLDKRFPFAKSNDPTDEPYYFRFMNDLGGEVPFSPKDDAVSSGIYGGGAAGFEHYDPVFPDILIKEIEAIKNKKTRGGRSSYIAFHTNGEMEEKFPMKEDVSTHEDFFKSYTKDGTTREWVKREGVSEIMKSQVGEFATFNEEGYRYVYGLPIFSKNEYNLQYGINAEDRNSIVNNYLVYKKSDDPDKTNILVGEESPLPYATTYLLTEITTPDYVDRKLDGPSNDDFGGYTKFRYEQAYDPTLASDMPSNGGDKTKGEWFRWRIPYNGLLLDRKELSNPEDDIGTVTGGEKEIYYLKSIETKTHVAKFDVSDRLDGIEAASRNSAIVDRTQKGIKKLKKLNKICLYSKGDLATPIKTVYFEYDYSLIPGTPNKITGTSNTPPGSGRLTLKKVWFEYEGVKPAKINPYEFGYFYKKYDYPSPYQTIDNYGKFSPEKQNPPYDYGLLDRWGNYQYDGKGRQVRLNPWVNQNPDQSEFDPAAWQLKQIRLPSGGEIHIQYEQDDYRFVQNKPALAMVSLFDTKSTSNDTLFLRTYKDLGIQEEIELQQLKKLIEKQLVGTDKKIYFKFIYALIGSNPGIDRCNSEYIDGYAKVEEVGIIKRKVPDQESVLFIRLGGEDHPQKICKEFVQKNRNGILNQTGDCSSVGPGLDGSAEENVLNLLSNYNTYPDSRLCIEQNYNESYLRIPMTRPKLGGGLRVKRLLMFDKGIGSEKTALYGHEYVYERLSEDGRVISSGVATTEPSTGREENALVSFLPEESQEWENKIIAGENKQQVEGPIGESILPAPSVGYEKIIVKNIHSGKTNPGIVVHEFNTFMEYPYNFAPYESRFISGSGTDRTVLKNESDFLPLHLPFFSRFISKVWMAQGFRFIINNMHGQPKAISTYLSNYGNIHNPNEQALVARKEYEYFQPGEKVPMQYGLDTIHEFPGKETEVIFESRQISDITNDFSLEGTANIGWFSFIPIPFLTSWPSYAYSNNELSTHATTKILRYPAILKSERSRQHGVWTTTEYVGFDPSTGRPISSLTRDGYHSLNLELSTKHDGSNYSNNIPASTYYPNMGQKSFNEGRIIRSDNDVEIQRNVENGEHSLTLRRKTPGTVCDILDLFYRGDLIHISARTGLHKKGEIYYVGDKIGNRIILDAPYVYDHSSNLATDVNVEILRSGRTNQLKAIASNITTYGPKELPVFHGIPIETLKPRQDFVKKLNSFMRHWRPKRGHEIYFDNCRISIGLDSVKGKILFFQCQPGQDCSLPLKDIDEFAIDTLTGEIVYFGKDYPCSPVPLLCFQFTPEYAYKTLAGVTEAGVQTFSDNWSLTDLNSSVYDAGAPFNAFEVGAKGKWRPLSKYVYQTAITSANDQNGRVYKDAGVFDEFVLYNWKHEAANNPDHWLKTNTVTTYSPNGDALEEKNIRGIFSTAKFGYGAAVPYLIAQNADYNSVLFESFETPNSLKFEDGIALKTPPDPNVRVDPTTAHAGHQSLKLSSTQLVIIPPIRPPQAWPWQFKSKPEEMGIELRTFKVSDQFKKSGLSTKVWVKSQVVSIQPEMVFRLKSTDGQVSQEVPMKKTAQSGDWDLYEAVVKDFSSFMQNQNFIPSIVYKDDHGSPIWIDDVRIQPLDAQMSAYVYDTRTLRLLTSFDDQHFGLYYQYNAEGKLIRKIIETERGMKTIEEAQYNTPKRDKQ